MDATGAVQGFTLTAGLFRTIDVPQAVATVVSGINDSNQIVGPYQRAGELVRGFSGTLGTTGTLDYPTDPQFTATSPSGINNAGLVAGSVFLYAVPPYADNNHGFLSAAGKFDCKRLQSGELLLYGPESPGVRRDHHHQLDADHQQLDHD